MANEELPKSYQPSDYEDQIYQKWEKSGYFNPDNLLGEPYSIMMPPPNVTGVLHLGHALENSLMDVMARYQRMRGKKVLLLPGTDHAAVATQAKVEKLLVEQGIKNPRQELGREKLLEKIKDYADRSKATILQQIKKMGTSCDWSRLAYTFDEQRSRAVNEVFIKMYKDGLIYRGKRIVNWDATLKTTISDDEIVWQEEKTSFYYLKYGPFVISTARPETKFGDKYVVMHPDDKRYKKYKHGDKFNCEWINGKVTATVIKDSIIDPKFGTGVMTITPWHDMIDFEIAQRHNLDAEQIIDFQGKLMPVAGEFAGLDILEARPKIVAKLKAKGLVVKVDENYLHRVAKCYRSNGLVEPQIKEQWFVDVNKIVPGNNKSLKDLMRQAVTVGHNGDPKQKIKITPARFERTYLHWIDNLRDWCISRQIWWGHRIPVYYRKQGISNFQFSISNKISKHSVEITYFVHGTTLDNEKELASGHYDVELSELGIKQSKKLAVLCKNEKFDVIFSSDLKRAVESAKLAFGKRGVMIIKDKRLRECDYGKMTGKSEKQVLAMEKDLIDESFPGGESYQEVENRMRSFLRDLFNKYQGKKVAIMAHKGPQLALEVILNNKSWQQALAEDWRKNKAWQPGWRYEFEFGPKIWELKIYGSDIFEAIKNGSKTIETRAGRAKGTGKDWGQFKKDDIIKFYLADEKTDKVIAAVEPIERSVKSVKHFKTIEQIFKVFESNQDYPGKSVKEIKQWWAKRPALNNRIKKYGIWAIELAETDEQQIYVGSEPPEEKTNFIFLHGFYRTREVKDPLGWLNQKFTNKNNFWSILPDPDKPNLNEQKDFVLANAVITPNTVIVTHSLGGVLALKMIEEKNLKVKKLILIAPPLRPHSKELKDYNPGNKFDFKKIRNNIKEIIIFQAGQDHVIPPEETAELARELKADVIRVENAVSHFNSNESQEILEELKKDVWIQDEDTLDTWFSSGLWTFSTLGFPERTKDLRTFHPTSWMQMGYEILFFWMARMILMSTYALDQVPFKDVYIHGMLRDELGKKFSKSAGNSVDPLEIIKEYGTDALRFSLLSGVTPGNDQRFYEEKIEGARNLVNKLWNVARFILQTADSRRPASPELQRGEQTAGINYKELTLADKWILEKMNSLVIEVTDDLENYRFSQAGEKLREFSWNDLADWYIEASKFEKSSEKEKILLFILPNLLKLWHPFMPFMTEYIWSLLNEKKLLMVASWPDKSNLATLKGAKLLSGDFELIKEIIIVIRNARSIYKIPPSQKTRAIIYADNKIKIIEQQAELIKKLRTGINELEIREKGKKIKNTIYLTVSGVEIYLVVPDFDFVKERERLNKEIKTQQERIENLERKLANKEFTAKAPIEIVEKEKEKLKLWQEELKRLNEQLKSLR